MSLFAEPPRRPGTDESGAGDREEFDAAATPSQGGETPRSVVVSGRVFMGPSAAPVASVLDLIELAYAAPTAHAKVCQVLDRLSEFVPFASAVWLPVDDELELAAGYQVGCSADEVAIYLRDHAASDPFLRVAPCPDQLNVPVHLNTVGAVAAERTTLPGALAHPHALGILAGSLGHAVAFVRLQRTADHGKFTRAEAATAKQVLHHLARAVLAQRVLGKGTAHLHSAMLVFADDGRLLYQTEGARRILRALPPGKILDFVNQRRQVLALIGGRAYRAKTLVPSHRSLLARFVQPHPGPAKGDDRGFPAKSGATVVIQLAAAQARRDVPERMRRMRLSVREIEVALMLLPGYPVAQIAARCGVHLQTAKEHVSAIYRKSGTASRAEFVAAVLGLKAALVV